MTKISDLPNLDPYYNQLYNVQFVANGIEQEGGDYITGQLDGGRLPSMLLSGVVYYNYLDSESLFLYKASQDDNAIHGITPQDFIDSWLYYDSPESVNDETEIIIAWGSGEGQVFTRTPVDSLADYIKSTWNTSFSIQDLNNHFIVPIISGEGQHGRISLGELYQYLKSLDT